MEVGRTLHGKNRDFTIVGVYSSVGQGGKTALGQLPAHSGPRLFTVFFIDVADGVEPQTIVDRYKDDVEPGRITDAERIRQEMLGGIVDGLTIVNYATQVGSLLIVGLITLLFVRLFMVRAQRRRSIMQALGGPPNSYRAAVLTQMLLPSTIGAILATALSYPLVNLLMSTAGSVFGSSGFQIDPMSMFAGAEIPLEILAVIAAVTALAVHRLPASQVARDVAGQED
ncbi:FtsX-like permease family protein [Corynebacterium ulceribovis]|uniref:FtsX-like permease family protein n=1 Tax=Corynebacterium ulceribovis TaxID=487732 RepID=UPI00037E205F|nr:FtsX-like permease family protein [Corynebacterium ulceribovis]